MVRRRSPRPAALLARPLLVALAVLATACASFEPSAPTGGVPLACLSIPAADCQPIAAQALRQLTGPGTVAAVTVEAYPCDEGQCPAGFEARRELTIIVELREPARIHQFGATTMFTGTLTFDAGLDAPSVEVHPMSARIAAAETPFATGHCGLWSPIDVDGSLWDVVGAVDGGHGVIGESTGRIVLVGPDRARYETDAGVIVELARREGARSFRGCD